jgi:hypothetical protein
MDTHVGEFHEGITKTLLPNCDETGAHRVSALVTASGEVVLCIGQAFPNLAPQETHAGSPSQRLHLVSGGPSGREALDARLHAVRAVLVS